MPISLISRLIQFYFCISVTYYFIIYSSLEIRVIGRPSSVSDVAVFPADAPVVKPTPAGGALAVTDGSSAALACMASGNPTPTVTWTKKVSRLATTLTWKLRGAIVFIPPYGRGNNP